MCNWLKKLFGIKSSCEHCHHCDNCGDKHDENHENHENHEDHPGEVIIGAQTTEMKVEPTKAENTEKVQ